MSSSSVTTVSRKLVSRSHLKESGWKRIGNDAREPRRVENALVLIEIPGAVLLGEEAPLQSVGEPAHRHMQH